MADPRSEGLHPAWWTLIFVVATAGAIVATTTLFSGSLRDYVPVTLTSDRAGLVMDRGAKVKLRGVQIGQVGRVSGGGNQVSLRLEIEPDQMKYIPANIEARIRAGTLFSGKFVELVYPSDPSPQRLAAGAVINSDNVSTEINTMFSDVADILKQVDPAKLQAVLSALADGLRGRGTMIGQTITDTNAVLTEVNARADTISADRQAVKEISDTYSGAAQDILTTLDAAGTISTTITDNVAPLDVLLTGVVGLARSGIDLMGTSQASLTTAVTAFESTARLLLKYNPTFTCTLVGAKTALDTGYLDATGAANHKSLILDSALLFGPDAYRYPQNLPIIGAKGGPGGTPGCGSLPDVAANWPLRQLITNTGWGTGLDIRPNPGIGFPGYADYFPVTRGVPESPSVRYPGGPAPGPIPYPGSPPYGATLYAPDGTPLWPGLPPAPPPGAAREPGPPPPGAEPFVVPAPAHLQPTPTPPLPEAAAPSP
ncbi:MCE family protein [Mycobacterium sp. CVI_P3]|uniref:MCE family protein n=1 Tax=Mycobacterium pinniadriaticum TaxID=2994102 RepID=A0ABT3S869_9MYCO|nr:MCE family protein [Mycobacterium pinniadriaticum]MCX2929259.1 MCE family protein [Mycobacterium pinniadriaticum]MCX2935684.1 MCE family protein [Mycobacterium pinniadriaticum]